MRGGGADLQGGVGLGGLGPACCQHTALLMQLAPPHMLTRVRADRRQQQCLHLQCNRFQAIFLCFSGSVFIVDYLFWTFKHPVLSDWQDCLSFAYVNGPSGVGVPYRHNGSCLVGKQNSRLL